jgi:conjugative transfer pilus assembly protein TraH
MNRKLLAIGIWALFFLGFLPSPGWCAGWVDDWIDQKVETSPGYFEGQKRGYYTGGGFSARWNLQNDYLWSVTPPRLKTGCGGIDAFMGGFSFMDPDYLVQKLQRIMSAAPAAAFDVALKVLAPQVSDTIRSLESIADRLNNIQLNECKSSRALVATIASPFAPQNKQGELAAIQADWWQSTGGGDLWTEFQKLRQADNDKPDPTAATASMAGCSADFRSVFTGGSILEQAGARVGVTSADYLNLIRGYVGDIFIQAPNPALNINAYKVVYDKPCDQDKGLKDLLDGTAQGKPTNGACTTISDANRNLRRYVQNRLSAIAARYRNRQPLSPADQAFINASPLAVGLVLKTAVGEQQEGAVIAQLSDVTAKAYAYSILTDMYAKTRGIFETAKNIMSTQSGPAGNNATSSCRIENVSESMAAVEKIENRLFDLMREVQTEYATTVAELNTIYEFVRKQQRFSEQAYQSLRQRFGEGVASRAMNL